MTCVVIFILITNLQAPLKENIGGRGKKSQASR